MTFASVHFLAFDGIPKFWHAPVGASEFVGLLGVDYLAELAEGHIFWLERIGQPIGLPVKAELEKVKVRRLIMGDSPHFFAELLGGSEAFHVQEGFGRKDGWIVGATHEHRDRVGHVPADALFRHIVLTYAVDSWLKDTLLVLIDLEIEVNGSAEYYSRQQWNELRQSFHLFHLLYENSIWNVLAGFISCFCFFHFFFTLFSFLFIWFNVSIWCF